MGAIMNPNKALWDKGDFAMIATPTLGSGQDVQDELRGRRFRTCFLFLASGCFRLRI
jgi:hypothetical protein